MPSPQIEHPPGGVTGHAFATDVGLGVVGFGVVGFGVVGFGVVGFGVVGLGITGADVMGADVVGTPTVLHSQTPIMDDMPLQTATISCLPA